MDLVRYGLEDVLDDLLPCARRVFEDERLIAVGDRRQRGLEREAVRERVVHPFEHVIGDARADHLQ